MLLTAGRAAGLSNTFSLMAEFQAAASVELQDASWHSGNAVDLVSALLALPAAHAAHHVDEDASDVDDMRLHTTKQEEAQACCQHALQCATCATHLQYHNFSKMHTLMRGRSAVSTSRDFGKQALGSWMHISPHVAAPWKVGGYLEHADDGGRERAVVHGAQEEAAVQQWRKLQCISHLHLRPSSYQQNLSSRTAGGTCAIYEVVFCQLRGTRTRIPEVQQDAHHGAAAQQQSKVQASSLRSSVRCHGPNFHNLPRSHHDLHDDARRRSHTIGSPAAGRYNRCR